MRRVIDAHALMVYFEKEPGYEKVRDFFTAASEKGEYLLMTAVNWGEVFYVVAREYDIARAEEVARITDTLPIEIVDVDIRLAREAALLKAKHRLSYADCFCAGLARLRKAEVVTGDPEFKQVAGEVKVSWL